MKDTAIFRSLKEKIASVKLLGFYIFSILALSGCFDMQKLPSALNLYEERLTNVLGIEVENKASVSMPFPNRTSLAIDIPEIDMNLREFYGLNACPIKHLIAQRNTALGKIHLPSQRFIYEVEVINTLSQCVNSLGQRIDESDNINSSELKELTLIQTWLLAKQTSYPFNWANLITQSEEAYLALNQTDGFLNGSNEDPISLAIIDLRYFLSLNQQANRQHPPVVLMDDVQALESHLQSMQNHRFYAKFWRSLMLTEQSISRLNLVLDNALPAFQCHSSSKKQDFDILRNVFTKFFIQGIQPIASAFNNYQYKLSPLIDEIGQHPDLPYDFKSHISQRHRSLFASYTQAMSTHIQHWQRFFARCAVSPKSLVS
ncbi:DUF3080 family protein [Glaciecola sp. KUL10]|uniref:DUF3080 family protein n=1 Tax=Glaciecola sp. (strain KUL10) TaxID=2161813 RepID=UPI000D789115|nr:DUF3080 family protein [Glaciecola sp. KUL10]